MALTQVSPGLLDSNAQAPGFKNRLINGDFRIWQRGTSGFTTLNVYSADRWIVSGTTNSAVGQSTDVPAGFKYSLSMTGSGYPQTYQRIESLNCTDLVGQSVTISFWAKQTSGAGASSLGVNLYSANAADNFSAVTQIGSTAFFTGTTGWVQYSYTFTNLPVAAANGLQCLIYANTGSTATFLVTGFQLEKGSTATSFDYRPYGTELALCQRYYQLIDGYFGVASSTTQFGATIAFPIAMRASPLVGQTNTLSITDAVAADYLQSATNIGINSSRVSTTAVQIQASNFSGLTAYRPYMSKPSSTGYVTLSAEL